MGMPTNNTAKLDKDAIAKATEQIAASGTTSQPAIVKEFGQMAANTESAPKLFDPKKILITDLANRDPEEFKTEEFKIFKAGIEATGGNEVPGNVYALDTPTQEGHTHGLIFGNRRLIACLETEKPFKAIVNPKPDARTQIARMTRENDDRSGTAVWKRAHWVVENLKHFDSARQYFLYTGTSESLIARYQKIVTVPDEVIELCVSTLDVKLDPAYKLALYIEKDPEQFQANLAEVKAEFKPRSLPFVKLASLLTKPKKKETAKPTDDDIGIKDGAGNVFATYKVNRAKELRIVVKDASPSEVKRVAELLSRLR